MNNNGQRKTKVPGEAPVPAPHCLSKMLLLSSWERTRAYGGMPTINLQYRKAQRHPNLPVNVGVSSFVSTQFHSSCRVRVDCGLFLSGKKRTLMWVCVMTSYITLIVVISHQSRHYSNPEHSTHTNDFRSAAMPSRNRSEAADLASLIYSMFIGFNVFLLPTMKLLLSANKRQFFAQQSA